MIMINMAYLPQNTYIRLFIAAPRYICKTML